MRRSCLILRGKLGGEQERSEVDLSYYLSETRDFACFLDALLWVQFISPAWLGLTNLSFSCVCRGFVNPR